MSEPVRFTVTAEMGERWVPHFLGLLREMQRCGAVGASRTLALFADGDGDYRPRFEWDADAEPAEPTNPEGVRIDMFWDAG